MNHEEHEPAAPLEEVLEAEGVTEIARTIDLEITEAAHRGAQISSLTARNIAYLLTRTSSPIDGPLGELTKAREPDPDLAYRAANEAAPLGTYNDAPRTLARWVSWLAAWALNQQQAVEPEHGPTSGDAFHAFLLLPDTGPQDDDLLRSFRQFYVGSYGSLHEMTSSLSDIDSWRRQLLTFTDSVGISEFVKLDHDKIARVILQQYDIVAVHGKLHAFHK